MAAVTQTAQAHARLGIAVHNKLTVPHNHNKLSAFQVATLVAEVVVVTPAAVAEEAVVADLLDHNFHLSI